MLRVFAVVVISSESSRPIGGCIEHEDKKQCRFNLRSSVLSKDIIEVHSQPRMRSTKRSND